MNTAYVILERRFQMRNLKIDIEKEFRKTVVDVLEEVGKFKAKNETRIIIVVCEYTKMTIK